MSLASATGTAHLGNVPAEARYRLLMASPELASSVQHAARAAHWLAKSSTYDSIMETAALANTLHPSLIGALIVLSPDPQMNLPIDL